MIEAEIMESLLPLRIFEAVRLLHRLGYAGLRILPGMNASGSAWRIILFNVSEWDNRDEFGGPYHARESCVYSTGAENIFNNTVQFPEDVSHVRVAEAILDGMPSLQRTSLSQTGNDEYVRWYAMLASQIKTLSDLPVAYADYFDDSEGWELGWGSKRRFLPPPAYTAQVDEPVVYPKRDEHYVLLLCAQYLGSQCENQKTFSWLLGDPTEKTGKQKKLPVDGYWEEHDLIVEYHEKQHSEAVPFFDSKITATGMNRGEQRKIYDARKTQEIPKHGINLVIIDYRDFDHRKGKIVRNPESDLLVVGNLLKQASKNSRPGVTATFA